MFLGHYSVAILAKAKAPKTPLVGFAVATMAVDFAISVCFLAGIETAHFSAEGLVQDSTPYTHSLAMCVLWGALGALIARFAFRQSWPASVLLGAVVLSHWFCDLIVHRPELPLWPNGPVVGLHLYKLPVTDNAVEVGALAIVACIWAASRARDGLPIWPVTAFTTLLVVLNIAMPFLDFSSINDMAIKFIGVMLVCTLGAWLVDRADRRHA